MDISFPKFFLDSDYHDKTVPKCKSAPKMKIPKPIKVMEKIAFDKDDIKLDPNIGVTDRSNKKPTPVKKDKYVTFYPEQMTNQTSYKIPQPSSHAKVEYPVHKYFKGSHDKDQQVHNANMRVLAQQNYEKMTPQQQSEFHHYLQERKIWISPKKITPTVLAEGFHHKYHVPQEQE